MQLPYIPLTIALETPWIADDQSVAPSPGEDLTFLIDTIQNMSALSNILNTDGAERSTASEPLSNSLPYQSQARSQLQLQLDQLQPNGGAFDFDDLFFQRSDEIDFSNSLKGIPSLDFATLGDIQDGVKDWAVNQPQGFAGDKLFLHPDGHVNSGSSISQSQQDSNIDYDSSALSDVEMVDETENSSSDHEMVDDMDKVCYGMVCRVSTPLELI